MKIIWSIGLVVFIIAYLALLDKSIEAIQLLRMLRMDTLEFYFGVALVLVTPIALMAILIKQLRKQREEMRR